MAIRHHSGMGPLMARTRALLALMALLALSRAVHVDGRTPAAAGHPPISKATTTTGSTLRQLQADGPPQACPETHDMRSQAEVAQLVKLVGAPAFSNEKITALHNHVGDSPALLSAANVVQVVELFDFSADKIGALAIMDSFMAGLNCTDLLPLLDAMSFSSAFRASAHPFSAVSCLLLLLTPSSLTTLSALDSGDKITVLASIAQLGLIIDPHSTAGAAAVVNAFTFSSDKKTVIDILADAKPRSCIYGTITSKRVHFVVDVSGSMGGQFQLNGAALCSIRATQGCDRLT